MLRVNRSRFSCNLCPSTFSQKSALVRHVARKHSGRPPVLDCQVCGLIFRDREQFLHHYQAHAANNTFQVTRNAFKGVVKTYSKYHRDEHDLTLLFGKLRPDVIKTIRLEQNFGMSLKLSIVMIIQCVQLDPNGDIIDVEKMPFRSSNFQVNQYDELESQIHQSFHQIETHFEEFLRNGSNWVMDNILETRIEFAQCGSLNGMCGELSTVTQLKDIDQIEKSLSMKTNWKGDCFYLCVAHHILKEKNQSRLREYVNENLVKVNKNEEGMNVKDIQKFLNLNEKLKLRINIIYQEQKSLFPILVAQSASIESSMTLILHKIIHENSSTISHHYSYVEDLNKLMRKTYQNSVDSSSSYEKTFVCANCLQKFSTDWTLKEHENECLKNDPQILKFDEEPIKFTKHETKFLVPFIGFFDFESTCEDVSSSDKHCSQKTVIESKQSPCGYAYVIVDALGNVIAHESYLGENSVNHFLKSILKVYDENIEPRFQRYPEPQLSKEEEELFQKSTICHICENGLYDELHGDFDRVRDHCHITGKYLGPAHSNCNLQRSEKKIVPMFCHNFSGYDSHLILKHLNPEELIKEGELTPPSISGLPYNSEKIRTLQVGNFHLRDSFGFLQASLDVLTNNLNASGGPFSVLDQMKLTSTDEQRALLLRKGEIFT